MFGRKSSATATGALQKLFAGPRTFTPLFPELAVRCLVETGKATRAL
jgi:hypothetical protein